MSFLNKFLFFTISFLLLLNVSKIEAITKNTEINLDTSISSDDFIYTKNQNIIIGLMEADLDEFINDVDYYRAFYYYTIKSLGYKDIPFHYVIMPNGEIFEGIKGGGEKSVQVKNTSNDSIVILNIVDRNQNQLNLKNKRILKESLIEITNKEAINPQNIEIKKLSFVRNIKDSSVVLEAKDVFPTWNAVLIDILPEINSSYKPEVKTYSVKVSKSEINLGNVNPGEDAVAEIEIENLSENGLYKDTITEVLLSKKTLGTSLFYKRAEWDSTTEVSLFNNGESLRPKEKGKFEIKLKIPLSKGNFQEEFVLKTADGLVITDQTIVIKVIINASEKPIVEIQETETGTLNVREIPSSVGPIYTQVSPGQRFFLVETDDTGWIRIDLGDGSSGWIAGWLVNYI